MQDSYVDTLAIVSGVTTASLVIAIVIVILIVIVIFHIFKQKQNKMIYNLNSCTHSER